LFKILVDLSEPCADIAEETSAPLSTAITRFQKRD